MYYLLECLPLDLNVSVLAKYFSTDAYKKILKRATLVIGDSSLLAAIWPRVKNPFVEKPNNGSR